MHHAERLRLDEYAVEITVGIRVEGRLDRAVAAEGLVEVDVGFLAQRVDAKLEQFAQAFRALEPGQRQLVLPERSFERTNPFALFQRVVAGHENLEGMSDVLWSA